MNAFLVLKERHLRLILCRNHTIPFMIPLSLHDSIRLTWGKLMMNVCIAAPLLLTLWATFMILRSTIITRHWIMPIAAAVGLAETFGSAERSLPSLYLRYIFCSPSVKSECPHLQYSKTLPCIQQGKKNSTGRCFHSCLS